MSTPLCRIGQSMNEQKNTSPKATIVIIDDEQSILKELRILLGRAYNVHVFANPVEAEQFVYANPVDMVISDEMMPEMRGSVLLGRIHSRHPDICNIVLSGQAEKDDIVKAVNEGHIFSFLYKPTERQQLINVIEKGLESRNMKKKLAEQNTRLREYSERLEHMVEEKTSQLIKAYDRLNLLDTNKMYFLVYLSQEMDSSLDRIQKLAEELLSYFAVAGSDLQVSMESVRLGRLVEEVLEDLQSQIKEKNITVAAAINQQDNVAADPEYLHRVIRMVLDNALVYTPAGGRIAISSGKVGAMVRLTVADSGRGIEEADLETIFKPFMLEREKRNPDGFGLRLPMARAIIAAMQGRIEAHSKGPGTGAAIILELAAG